MPSFFFSFIFTIIFLKYSHLKICCIHSNHFNTHDLSHVMRNQCFAYAKTKTQISFAVTAKLISAFVFALLIVQSLLFLNPGLKPDCWFSHDAAHLQKEVLVMPSTNADSIANIKDSDQTAFLVAV